MKKVLLLLTCILFGANITAQNSPDTTEKKELPFFIHERKRMPEFEIEEKKEGTFLTGLPRFQFDPIRGFGAGGDINIFFNGDRNDPFFEFTPYRHAIKGQVFLFENGRARYELGYDAPYIFNTRWRVRADAVYWEDPDAQYWGMGRDATNRALEFRDKKTGATRQFGNVRRYEDNLGIAELEGMGNEARWMTDLHYNNIRQKEQLYNLLGERVFMGGKLRVMFGYEALFTQFQSWSGRGVDDDFYDAEGNRVDEEVFHRKTKVDEDIAAGVWDEYNLGGFNNDDSYMFTSMLAGALIYDTRDYEPDPSKGVFFEYSHEWSLPELGSDFNFNKFMLQGQYINTLARWRNGKSRLTFAGMGSLGYVWGSNINFIEMWDLSSQAEAGGIMVMGGERSIRGYREARFMAPATALINLEMRARLYDVNFLKQHLILGVTPFFDAGNVWDNLSDINLSKWRVAPGMGARIAWNQSTILRLDFARGSEGSQTFFGFGHIF